MMLVEHAELELAKLLKECMLTHNSKLIFRSTILKLWKEKFPSQRDRIYVFEKSTGSIARKVVSKAIRSLENRNIVQRFEEKIVIKDIRGLIELTK